MPVQTVMPPRLRLVGAVDEEVELRRADEPVHRDDGNDVAGFQALPDDAALDMNIFESLDESEHDRSRANHSPHRRYMAAPQRTEAAMPTGGGASLDGQAASFDGAERTRHRLIPYLW